MRSAGTGNRADACPLSAQVGVTVTRARDFKTCTVLGGAGLLGYEIVRQLLRRGVRVKVLDLVPLEDSRCECFRGDIRDPEAVRKACVEAEVVFQTAAAVWDPALSDNYYRSVNVEGNRTVVRVCRELRIRRLVYTSTIDVVVDGRRPIRDGDESLPYPHKPPRDPYSRSKIEGERLVLAANSPELATCALRPVGMFGPRDRYHLGNLIDVTRRGRYVRLGDGRACFSHVYSENAAYAHLLAAERLYPGSPIAGQVYFIADDQPPGNLFAFAETYFTALGLQFSRRRLPYPLAYALAWAAEFLVPRSRFTRFSVVQTCVDHTYSDAKARRELGYRPLVSPEEAFRRTLAYWQECCNSPAQTAPRAADFRPTSLWHDGEQPGKLDSDRGTS